MPLRRQGRNFALDTDALADGIADVVQDFRQVAADFALDVDGRDHKVQVGARHAPGQVRQGAFLGQPQLNFLHHPVKLYRDGRRQLAPH